MAQNILSSGSGELRKVMDMLAEVKGLRTSMEEVRADKVKADRALQAAEKSVSDSINSTVKKRRADLESGFNKEIQKEQAALKKVRNARDKAKSKGVAGRVAEETSELREKNRMLHAANRSLFKQKGLPRFCDTKLYYALYMPSRISDILACVVFIALFFVLLPGVGSFFVKELWQKILVFAAVWLVVGGFYALIYRVTKGKNRAVLADIKDSWKEIRKNEKEIRRIRKMIHADKSEMLYNLEGFDRDIRTHEDTIRELTDRKNVVLQDFETETKKTIADDITAKNADRIKELRDQCDGLAERHAALKQREKELSADLASNYQAYLGLEFMDAARLQALADLIDSGKAATVGEAMDVWEKQQSDRLSGQSGDTIGAEADESPFGDRVEDGTEEGDAEIPDFGEVSESLELNAADDGDEIPDFSEI